MVWRESTQVTEAEGGRFQEGSGRPRCAPERDVRLNEFFEDKWEALPTGKAVRSCKDNK